MELLHHEVEAIGLYLNIDPSDPSKMPITPHYGSSKVYHLTLTSPCFFMDKATNLCIIHDVKPLACKDYPFRLRERLMCNWLDVFCCLEACQMMDIQYGLVGEK